MTRNRGRSREPNPGMVATRRWWLAGWRMGAAVLLAAVLAACPPRREDTIKGIADAFAADLMWERYEFARARMAPDLQFEIGEAFDTKDEKIRVTQYEIKETIFDKENNRAVIRVEFEWMITPSPVMKRGDQRQWWEKQEENWVLVRVEGDLFEEFKALRKKQEKERLKKAKKKRKADGEADWETSGEDENKDADVTSDGGVKDKKKVPAHYIRKPDI